MSGVYAGAPQVDADSELRNLQEARTGLDAMLHLLLREGGSDLHVQADESPRIRKDGDLIPIPDKSTPDVPVPPQSRTTLVRFIELLLSGNELEQFRRANAVAFNRLARSAESANRLAAVIADHRSRGIDVDADTAGFDSDTAYELAGGVARFRVNVSFDRGNPRIVMRKIPTKIMGMSELGLPSSLRDLVTLQRGLVLVTGPTGSGKTTTLAAIIDEINDTRACSVLTIEDPIEFVHHSKQAMVAQREVGEDTPSFAEALRRGLRQDPDVVLVGELRDLETTRIALEAAETGHLVFGTMHTKSAKDTMTRIVGQYPANEQEQVKMMLVGSLRAAVGQVLLKKNGGGRVAAMEIMKVTPAIRAQLGSKTGFQQIDDSIRGSGSIGNRLLDDHLYSLVVEERLITAGDAIRAAIEPTALSERLARAGAAPTS